MASVAGWLVSVFSLLSRVTLMSSSAFGIRAKPWFGMMLLIQFFTMLVTSNATQWCLSAGPMWTLIPLAVVFGALL
jgi:hypothetical protein